MTSEALAVYLDGTLIGALTQSRQGQLGFSYDDSYLTLADPTPLSLAMPLRSGSYASRVVRAFIEGLLPDNPAVRDRWGTTYDVSPNNPFALLRHVGRDAAGAVQIVPDGETSSDAGPDVRQVEWLTDKDFVALVHDLAEHRSDWNPGRYAGRWSLAGAQSKVALFRAPDGSWGIPAGSTPTTHIIKPALEGFADHHLNEVLCQRVARILGLPAAASELIEVGDVRAIVSTRYDRTADPQGRIRRLHQEDLCQALSVDPSRKYQADGGPGVGEIADLFTRLNLTDRVASANRFLDALVYNVLIGGTDAHAKNYSLLLQGSRAQLAPLYDLASAVAYPSDRPLESSMRIGDHRIMREVSPTDWAKVGRRLGLGGDTAVGRFGTLRDALPGALDEGMSTLPASTRRRAERLAEQITSHAESLARSWR